MKISKNYVCKQKKVEAENNECLEEEETTGASGSIEHGLIKCILTSRRKKDDQRLLCNLPVAGSGAEQFHHRKFKANSRVANLINSKQT